SACATRSSGWRRRISRRQPHPPARPASGQPGGRAGRQLWLAFHCPEGCRQNRNDQSSQPAPLLTRASSWRHLLAFWVSTVWSTVIFTLTGWPRRGAELVQVELAPSGWLSSTSWTVARKSARSCLGMLVRMVWFMKAMLAACAETEHARSTPPANNALCFLMVLASWGTGIRGGGPPYTIRTCDRSLRRRVLYPTELRAGYGPARMITRGNCTVPVVPPASLAVQFGGGRHPQHHGVFRADADHPVPHAAVYIEALSGRQAGRLVVLGVQLDLAAQHVDEFLAAVPAPVLEFAERARLDPRIERHHALVRQRVAQQPVVVVRRFVGAPLAAQADGAAAGPHVLVRRHEQLGHVQLQPGGDLQQVVVGGRQQAVLDLGQRRGGDAGGLGSLLQGPVARLAQVAQPLRQGALL